MELDKKGYFKSEYINPGKELHNPFDDPNTEGIVRINYNRPRIIFLDDEDEEDDKHIKTLEEIRQEELEVDAAERKTIENLRRGYRFFKKKKN